MLSLTHQMYLLTRMRKKEFIYYDCKQSEATFTISDFYHFECEHVNKHFIELH